MTRRLFAAGLAFAFAALCAHGQAAAAEKPEAQGTLALAIQDTHQTPIASADIKAVRIVDSKTVEAKSDGAGACKLVLPVGTYCLTVRAPNCRPDFTGGVVVRADSVFPVKFTLYPGDPNEKLPHEKAPQDRADELAKIQAAKGKEEQTTAATVVTAAYAGLDEACKACKIERTNGGPGARADHTAVAMELLRDRDFAGALTKLKKALGEDPSDAEAWFNCGVLFLHQRQSGPSAVCMRTAIGLCGGGGKAVYHAHLGRALGAQGDLAGAEKCFKAAAILDPDNEAQYTYDTAIAYHSAQSHAKAAELFKKAIDLKYGRAEAVFGYANALEMLGRKNEALAQYRLFMEKSKDDPELADYRASTEQKIARLSK